MTRHQKWLTDPENREMAREATKRWKQNNRARVNSYQASRRHRLTSGGYTQMEWNALLNEWSNACAYCGSTETLEADHIVPLSRGGPNTIENIVPACQKCNRSKGPKFVGEWLSQTRWNV